MASSSGGDFSEPPRGPNPPAGMIAGQGQSTPFKPNFINFLGDTNVPSRGLTPDMLAAINATNGPPPGSMPPQAAGAAAAGAAPVDKRAMLARAMMQQQQQMHLGRNGSAGGW